MPFHQVDPKHFDKSSQPIVRARIKESGITIGLNAALLALLGWKPGSALTVLVGSGDDSDLLALQPQAGGGPIVVRQRVRGSAVVQIPRWPGLAVAEMDRTKVAAEHRANGKLILAFPVDTFEPPVKDVSNEGPKRK